MSQRNNIKKLDCRLSAAAEYARPGAVFADIGTDHAYLPVSLCLRGTAPSGVASDLREGPCRRAAGNIEKAGLSDRISVVRADGLDGIERFSPEDIYILGMGGELIAAIIGRSEYAKKSGVRLILQPMTHPERLRAFLLGDGFEITDEKLVSDQAGGPGGSRGGRGARSCIYQLICARYTGERRIPQDTPEEAAVLLLGKINIEKGGGLLSSLALSYARSREEEAAGLRASGCDREAAAERAALIAAELKKIAAGCRKDG